MEAKYLIRLMGRSGKSATLFVGGKKAVPCCQKRQILKHDASCFQGNRKSFPCELGNNKSFSKNTSKVSTLWNFCNLDVGWEIPTWNLTWNICTLENQELNETVPLRQKIKKAFILDTVRPCDSEVLFKEERWSHESTNQTMAVPILAVFSFFSFSKSDDKESEEKQKDVGLEEEDRIIFLLKKAKLSIMKSELEDAERILHQAARLAHESDNKKAIIYTYDLMANLALMRGHYDSAEKLFKVVMSLMLAADTTQDDNAFIEISLKLASIYAVQNRHTLAFAGYEFCILTLEEKTEKQKELPVDELTEEKDNTLLLFGLCMDSYARYLLANKHLPQAQTMCERALKICMEVQGEAHPQTVVLMNDLAAVLDSQGQHDKALNHVKRASELARQTEHPDEHVVLSNLAGILMHQGAEHFEQAKKIFKEALELAEKKRDEAVIQQIQEGLAELSRRKAGLNKRQDQE
ncbi:tetratricopeptide repeat protein 19, mitochondrial isoform X2 [Lissotriton helveticus]